MDMTPVQKECPEKAVYGPCKRCGGRHFHNSEGKPRKLIEAFQDLNVTIGRIDRLLSEFLILTERWNLDTADAQTLKHHVDDLIGVGTKALKTLSERGLKCRTNLRTGRSTHD